MIQQAYTRTDLAKQEAMIDEWKKEHGIKDVMVKPTEKSLKSLPKDFTEDNSFLFQTDPKPKKLKGAK